MNYIRTATNPRGRNDAPIVPLYWPSSCIEMVYDAAGTEVDRLIGAATQAQFNLSFTKSD